MKNFFAFLLLMAALLLAKTSRAQSVGIGTPTPSTRAVLDLTSTTQGLLIPRLTAAQRGAIATPPQGLMVYQTDGTAGGGAGTGFWYFAGSGGWVLVNPAPAGDNLGNHTATQALNLQGQALTGTGASIGAAVGVGVRADGGLNLGQNTSGNNVLLGYQAGSNNTSGSVNFFAGYRAGHGNTSGSENVYVGGEAGAGAGTGGANTALGYRAAHSLVSGSSNTMLGFWAGRLTTSGTQNLFAGAGSGFSNQSGSQNVYLGPSAGVLSTGSDNVFVGFSAGNGGVLGNEGVALGSRAGRSNTANGNHFVGFQAGYSNTDKDKQHFEGYQAGYSNTSGSANHFAGYQAGYGNTSGSENVYVGGEAGAGAGTGGANTALGYRAAHSLVSGSSNTMLGFWAGRLTTSGTQNLFAGAGSGFSNQSGSQNVYLGPSAGVLSTGSDNVFVGFSAGNSNATGTHNTLVGSGAKLTTNGLTNAAAFGYKAEASQSNSLVLGGTGADAVNVGIGTTAPGATLDVRRGTATSGTAAFSGTTRVSHFSYDTAEDTYIRGGKATANVLLNDNGGRVGIRTPAPNSGLQVASSLSVPFRAVYQTAGAYVNVTLSDDDHTVRSGSPTGVVGGAVFSFLLPAPGGSPGRTYVLLNYGDTPANLYASSGANPFGLNLIYDDATSAYLAQIPANARLTLQSDGGTWLVLAR